MARRPILLALWLAGCSAGSVSTDAGSRRDGGAILPEGGVACRADFECADRVACTIDRCRPGGCEHVPCADCCDEGRVCVPGFGCAAAPQPCEADVECRDEVRCTLDSCRDGACAHDPEPGLCPAGEICLPAAGCIPEPPTTCASAADCEARGAFCVGAWSCDPEFGCQFVSLRDCDDGDTCTADTCDVEGARCVHTPRDADGDGHAEGACGGDDCDDTNAAVHPGAAEVCGNDRDDDCDGLRDEGCCESELACSTTCGTEGRTTCDADGTMRCAPPLDVCNGADDDCDASTDEGFECVLGRSEACTTGCGSSGRRACEPGCAWGLCAPPVEECNGIDDDCDGLRDEGFACAAGTSSSCPTTCGSTGTRVCLGDCTLDACAPPAETCNGVDDDCDGACDDGFACCEGTTRACSTLGFFAGTATCPTGCAAWNTSTCTNCGDGTTNTGEECDGTDLAGATCASLGMGFAGGTLRCSSSCRYDASMCTRCGNGVIDSGEQCDGTNLGGATCSSVGSFTSGTLRCSASCAYDTSMCRSFDPSGVYSISPAPSKVCAFGLVSFNIGSMTFSDSGAVLVVNGAPCVMTGTSARSSRMFDVSCVLSGSCTETYRLAGSYSTDDQWSGTFSATFTPSSSGACYDCSSQSWSVTGTR